MAVIEQWLLVIWISSRQLGITVNSYDTRDACLAAIEKIEHDPSAQPTCVNAVVKSGRHRRKRR